MVQGVGSQGVYTYIKHFAVNSQELRRMASNSVLDERTLRVNELLELVLSTTAAMEKAPRKFDEKAHHELAQRAAAEFEALLGRPLPEETTAIDRTMTLGELHHSRSPQ